MSGKYQAKRVSSGNRPGKLHGVLTIPAMLISAVFLVVIMLCIHPFDADSSVQTKTGRISDGLEELSRSAMSTAVSDALAFRAETVDAPENVETEETEATEEESVLTDILVAKKTYTIDENAQCGEVPNPDCYGSSADPDEVEAVIAEAAELLNGQETAWNRDLPFKSGTFTSWYFDETILVLTWQELKGNVTYYCSEVKIADPSQFRRMLAGNTYGASQQLKCTSMAASANAVLAANADFYMYRSSGINVYQGQLYRFNPKLETCFIDEEGNLLVTHTADLPTEESVIQYIEDNNISFSLSFGPILVENSVPITSNYYYVGQGEQQAARSAIGQLGELHYILMNVNYTTISRVAEAMAEKQAYTAYALDGGQTAETVFGGTIFNRIVYDSERNVSDIIYFATAYPWEADEE